MIPNPWDVLSGAAGSVAGWSWDQVATGIARWVLGAIAELVDGVLNFLKTSARPDVTDAWFSGAGSPYASVRNVSAVLLIGFLLLTFGASNVALAASDALAVQSDVGFDFADAPEMVVQVALRGSVRLIPFHQLGAKRLQLGL